MVVSNWDLDEGAILGHWVTNWRRWRCAEGELVSMWSGSALPGALRLGPSARSLEIAKVGLGIIPTEGAAAGRLEASVHNTFGPVHR